MKKRSLSPALGLFERFALLSAAAFILVMNAACAAQWALREEKPEIALQWPPQPEPAAVVYVSALRGLSAKTGPASLLHAVVYGGGEADEDAFRVPVSVATGLDGRIAVADSGCRCVHLYLPVQKQYLRIAGTKSDSFQSPVGVIFDDQMHLYVSDSVKGTVFKFGSDGAFLSALPGEGAPALKRPTGLAYSSREKLLYVVDTLSNRVIAFRPDGTEAFVFGERGEAGGQFNFPTHIWASAAGAVYVTDALNFRVAVFDERGRFLRSFGHHGDGSGDFARPKGLAVDRMGTVYIADSLFDNVQLFNGNGEFLLTLGRRGMDFGEFWIPSGIFLDEKGLLYVCDSYNGRVQIFRVMGQQS